MSRRCRPRRTQHAPDRHPRRAARHRTRRAGRRLRSDARRRHPRSCPRRLRPRDTYHNLPSSPSPAARPLQKPVRGRQGRSDDPLRHPAAPVYHTAVAPLPVTRAIVVLNELPGQLRSPALGHACGRRLSPTCSLTSTTSCGKPWMSARRRRCGGVSPELL